MIYAAPGQKGSKVSYKSRYENYIGGKWVRPAKEGYFQNITPVTGQPFCEVPRSTAEDIEQRFPPEILGGERPGDESPTQRRLGGAGGQGSGGGLRARRRQTRTRWGAGARECAKVHSRIGGAHANLLSRVGGVRVRTSFRLDRTSPCPRPNGLGQGVLIGGPSVQARARNTSVDAAWCLSS